MLTGTSVAVYLAVSLLHVLPMQFPNIGGGALAFYLVLSAYMTVKRREGRIGLFERVSFLIPLMLGTLFPVSGGVKAEHSPKPRLRWLSSVDVFYLRRDCGVPRRARFARTHQARPDRHRADCAASLAHVFRVFSSLPDRSSWVSRK